MIKNKVLVTKEFVWDCAHMLSNHEGLCANVHGHTYKMEVTVSRTSTDVLCVSGSNEGMVIDFKQLKDMVKKVLVDRLDHAFITWGNGCEAEKDIAKTLHKHGMKTFYMATRPTAENMCQEFYLILATELRFGYQDLGIQLERIRIWETPTSYAEVNANGCNY